jgi:predicted PurR-regulated permease PerM
MGVLAIVPVLGAFVVWIPAAIFLALNGDWSKALILTAWGTIVVGGIDNLLYPLLVKDRMRLHTIPAFISIMGGLLLFGASGLLLGPLAVTVTMLNLESTGQWPGCMITWPGFRWAHPSRPTQGGPVYRPRRLLPPVRTMIR